MLGWIVFYYFYSHEAGIGSANALPISASNEENILNIDIYQIQSDWLSISQLFEFEEPGQLAKKNI